jgi:hypothetical protein
VRVEKTGSQTAGGVLALSAAATTAALVFAGWIGGETLRMLVQTSPLWLVMVLGWRGGGYARWAAAPMLGFWTVLAGVQWVDRLGWAHIAEGPLSSVEARVAVVVGVAGAIGLLACLVRQPRISPLTGVTLALACGALQIGAFYLGMQPSLAI